MLESIAGPRPLFEPGSVFVYMNDPFFDMTIPESLKFISSTEVKLHCLIKAENVSCERDYFAFNYETAKVLREKLLSLGTDTLEELQEAMNETLRYRKGKNYNFKTFYNLTLAWKRNLKADSKERVVHGIKKDQSEDYSFEGSSSLSTLLLNKEIGIMTSTKIEHDTFKVWGYTTVW